MYPKVMDDELFPPAETDLQPVIVPPESLSQEALWSLARDSLLRETGNDDPGEYDLEEQTNRLVASVRAGKHLVTFDPVTGTAGIIKRD